MIPPPLRRVRAWLLFACIWLVSSPITSAQPPEATRPYIELPFPRDSRYEVTCGYHCYQHRGSMSYAVDFAVPSGDPILAAAAGEVMAVTWEVGLPANLNLGDALIVYIDHGGGWFTRYVHLDGITVRAGDHVQMGDVIGYSGKTGASGDHLHFELKYGNSLHSPSVPIDELFDGVPPEAGEAYLSNNHSLSDALLLAAPEETPPTATATAAPAALAAPDATLPAPQVSQLTEARLPQVEEGLTLSAPTVTAGVPVTVTFTLRNTTPERLHLSILGVAGRQGGQLVPLNDALLFDRVIVLNPGRSYRFSRPYFFHQAGEVELFIFALGPHNEWIPLGGTDQQITVRVRKPPFSLFLPLVEADTLPLSGATPEP